MLQIKVMREHGSLRYFIPEVLDVPVPEFPYLSLVRRAGYAVNKSQIFDFIKDLGISSAGERRRRFGTKFVGPLQSKWSDLRPLGKIHWREVGRSQQIVSGLRSWDIQRWNHARSVGASCGEQLSGDCLANRYSLCFSLII